MKTKQIFDTVYSTREDGVVITGKGGILKTKLTKNGYHELALYDSGTKKYTWYRLNRLVAMVFIPNPENKPFVNHCVCKYGLELFMIDSYAFAPTCIKPENHFFVLCLV